MVTENQNFAYYIQKKHMTHNHCSVPVIAAKTVTRAVKKKNQLKPKKKINFVFINLNAQFYYNI